MDFVAVMGEMCPPSIVQKAKEIDLTKLDSSQIWTEIAFSDASPTCLSSVVGSSAERVTNQSNPNLIKDVLNLAQRVSDTNGPEVRRALMEMAQRINVEENYVAAFYEMLWANKIDLVAEHPPIPAPLWTVSTGDSSHIAFQRAIYLVRMGVPGAEEHLSEGLAVVSTQINPFKSHVQHMLLNARHPSYQRILEPYLSDKRRASGLFGPDHPIGDYIRAKLKDPLSVPK